MEPPKNFFGQIIDIHSHFNIGSPFDVPETELKQRNIDFIKKDYLHAGIIAGSFSPFSSVSKNPLSFERIYADNQKMNEIACQNDWVYQWLVLHPEREELFDQIKAMISHQKVLGVKIHSYYHGYDMEKFGDRIFSFCNDLQCVTLVHPKPGTAINLVKFADKYPNMKIIIAHLGHDQYAHKDAVEDRVHAVMLAKHENIYMDTSAHGIVLNNIVEYAVGKVGSEKIFFGTDTYSCGYEVGRIQYAHITDSDKENIFYNNAKKHFRKQFQND